MDIRELVKTWFEKWETGDYLNIPVADNFKHINPYGTIDGKEAYLNPVEANKANFKTITLKLMTRFMKAIGHAFDIPSPRKILQWKLVSGFTKVMS